MKVSQRETFIKLHDKYMGVNNQLLLTVSITTIKMTGYLEFESDLKHNRPFSRMAATDLNELKLN